MISSTAIESVQWGGLEPCSRDRREARPSRRMRVDPESTSSDAQRSSSCSSKGRRISKHLAGSSETHDELSSKYWDHPQKVGPPKGSPPKGLRKSSNSSGSLSRPSRHGTSPTINVRKTRARSISRSPGRSLNSSRHRGRSNGSSGNLRGNRRRSNNTKSNSSGNLDHLLALSKLYSADSDTKENDPSGKGNAKWSEETKTEDLGKSISVLLNKKMSRKELREYLSSSPQEKKKDAPASQEIMAPTEHTTGASKKEEPTDAAKPELSERGDRSGSGARRAHRRSSPVKSGTTSGPSDQSKAKEESTSIAAMRRRSSSRERGSSSRRRSSSRGPMTSTAAEESVERKERRHCSKSVTASRPSRGSRSRSRSRPIRGNHVESAVRPLPPTNLRNIAQLASSRDLWNQQKRFSKGEAEDRHARKLERRGDIKGAMLSHLDEALFRVNDVTGKREMIIELVA